MTQTLLPDMNNILFSGSASSHTKKLGPLSIYSVAISFLLITAKYKKYTSEPKFNLKFSKSILKRIILLLQSIIVKYFYIFEIIT